MCIQITDLDDLSRGAVFLGSGGGGDPSPDSLVSEVALLKHGAINLKPLELCLDDELVVLVAGVGAPLVSSEKISSGEEWKTALQILENTIGRRIDNIVSGEIGGSNAFAGIIASLLSGKHLIDADSLGRAFPKLSISSCALSSSISPSPAVMVDVLGNSVVFHSSSPSVFEKHARALVTAMGSSACCAFYPMTGKVAKQTLIPNSLSLAITIGSILRTSSSLNQCMQKIASVRPCKHLGGGIITEIRQEIDGGFLQGSLSIEGSHVFQIDFQNEFLIVFQEEKPICTTPDIIAIMETDSLTPLGSDQIRHGLSVEIVAMACPEIWKTPEGLFLTGPSAFGYTYKEELL